MYERLTELIQQGDYQEALYEFQEEYFHIGERSFTDAGKLCVLEATLWEALMDSVAEFEALSKACTYDFSNYEIYYMLALYYMETNVDKAFLCMEMALHYCHDDSDRAVIESSFIGIKEDSRLRVRNVSIMILSYNDLELLKCCIESVEKYAPGGAYEVVVVDNASTEPGVIEYLRKKREEAAYPFTLVENRVNLGFPAGCNMGVIYCNQENDIFFLNNDAYLTPNALFWLRMALYEDRNVGACGAMSNSASLQEIDGKDFADHIKHGINEETLSDKEKKYLESVRKIPEEDFEKGLWHKKVEPRAAIWAFEQYAKRHCGPLGNPYIKTFRLTGFALLLSRSAIRDVGNNGVIFDELFSPGYFEDDDLGIRLARAGYRQYICKNSLIYHNGGSGFESHANAMEAGRQKFAEKWGFDIWSYSLPWNEACDEIIKLAARNGGVLRVIDFTCGFGANASYLKSIYPEIYVAGVCRASFSAGIAKLIADDCIYGDINCIRIPWPEHSFDVAIAEKTAVSKGQIGRCLKPGGKTFLFE